MKNWNSTVNCINRKTVFLVFVLLFLSGSAAAKVPQLMVSPSSVETKLSAHNKHLLQFKFINNNSEKRIFNVTLENRSYLNWSKTRFSLNASESKTVNASFYKPVPGEVSDSFKVPYYFNQSGDITFNKNYYPEIRFNVSAFYENTTVQTDIFDRSFKLGFGESESSVFEIRNTGGETAFDVNFEARDISFRQDPGFNISTGGDRLIEFTVSIPKPRENATQATNQTYTRTVTVSGENFDEKSFTVEVFVPYKQYNVTEKSQSLIKEYSQLQQQIIQLCQRERFQDAVLCGGDIVRYRNRTIVVNRTPRANVTLTSRTIRSLNQLSNESVQGHDHLSNRIDLLKNALRYEENRTRNVIDSEITELAQVLNETNENMAVLIREVNQSQRLDNREDRRNQFWEFLFWSVTGLSMVGYLGYRGYVKIVKLENDRRF